MSLKYLNLSGLEDLWINIKNYILSKVPTKTSELTNDSGYLTSHQSLSNYVTLNTAQEITNAKTFKAATVRKLTSVEAGNVIPSSDKLISDIWQDKNGKELGRIYFSKTKGGNTALIMRAGDWFTSNEGVYTLDASGTNRRAELHLYTDSSGNCCIKPVGYFSATLKPLSSSVWLGEYGKPFGVAYVNQVRFTNATLQVDVDIDATEEHSIGFFGKNNSPLSYITFQKRPSFKDRVAIRIQTTSSSYKSYDFDATCFYPESNNSVDIGSTTNIFKNIYCNNYYLGTTAFGDIVTHNASEFLTSHQSLANYALDANVVHTSGNETIAGVKSFSDNTYIKSLNFTDEVPSPSSSNSAVLPIITTITYSDSSPSVQARLNFRVTADGIKSLYPHENLAYSLGLASRLWSDFYTYHGYFKGQQQNDEYSGNARTNLTLLANRDSIGQSGCVVDTFRENTTQGTAMHILGFGMKENSIRYEGVRFQWAYDSVNSGYNFNLKPTTQGTNNPLTYNLGTSTDKWDTINGLNPSSLGMPDIANKIDISSYITDLASGLNNYTPPANGWISVRSANAYKISILDSETSVGNTSASNTATYLTVMTPVVANRKVLLNVICTSLEHAYFIPCQGNV